MILKKIKVPHFFLISILFSLLVLSIERLVNINYDYHPDALTYLNNPIEDLIAGIYKNPLKILGNFYYIWVFFFNVNKIVLIILNIFLYALTNSIMFSLIKEIYRKKGWLYCISVLIIIFDPYRAHLSVHILKDTLIIFSLVLFLFSSSKIISSFGLILGFMLRLGFFVYLPIVLIYLNKKNLIFLTLGILVLFWFFWDVILSGISSGQKIDMAFRDFDRVYNFVEIGYPLGDIMRSLTWPVIRLTGLAVLFHPIYLLFLFQTVALTYLFFANKNYLNYKIIFFIISLVGLAIVTSGYNSYLRWSQPIITALSIWLAALPVDTQNLRSKTQK
jgi:hypothetical protein